MTVVELDSSDGAQLFPGRTEKWTDAVGWDSILLKSCNAGREIQAPHMPCPHTQLCLEEQDFDINMNGKDAQERPRSLL